MGVGGDCSIRVLQSFVSVMHHQNFCNTMQPKLIIIPRPIILECYWHAYLKRFTLTKKQVLLQRGQ